MQNPSRRLNTTLFLAMLPLGATATAFAPSALAASGKTTTPQSQSQSSQKAAAPRLSLAMTTSVAPKTATSTVKPSASAKSAAPKAAASTTSAAAPSATKSLAAKAASKSVAPLNLSVTADPHSPDGSYVAANTTVAITSTWGVPANAKAGDTTSVVLPAAFDGNTIAGLQIKDANTGAVVGTLSGSHHNYTVTYTNYVETHSNVQVTTSLAAHVDDTAVKGQKTIDISETVGGVTASSGTYQYVSGDDAFLTPLHLNQVQETTASYDMSVDNFTIPVAGTAPAGKTVTLTYRLPNPSDGNDALTTTPYASFDKSVLAPGAAINYMLYDYSGVGLNEAKLLGTYTTGAPMGDNNPVGLKIISSTDDTVVMQYQSPDDENKWLLVRPILQNPTTHEGGVLLNKDAVASQHEGPYASFIYTDYDGQGYPQYGNGTVAYGYYVFDKASASGTILSVVANAVSTSVHAGKSVTVDVPGNVVLNGDSTIKSVTITDKDGNPLGSDANGTWTVGPDNKPVFTAKAGDKAGTETVLYTVTDSNGTKSTNTITVQIVPADAPTAPTASGVDFVTKKNTPVHIDLSKHVKPTAPGATITNYQIKDPATGKLVSSLTVPGKGTLTVGADGQAVFTPAKDYTGPVPIFMIVATDSNGQTVSFPVSGAVTDKQGHHDGGHAGRYPGGTPSRPSTSQPIHLVQPGQPVKPGQMVQPGVGPKVQTDFTGNRASTASGNGIDGELAAGFVLVSIAGGLVLRRTRRS